MQNTSKKALSTLLALALALVLFAALPTSALAADETVLAAGFNTIPGLTAVADTTTHTVTVTGDLTTANNTPLPIDTGVTIIWKANYAASSNDPLIILTGSGTFEIAQGSIKNTGNGDAIFSSGAEARIIVNGGTVSSAGQERSAIFAGGEKSIVTVNSGTLSATAEKGYAICTGGENTKITVSGGTLSATGKDGAAIYPAGPKTTITVEGGAVNATGEGGNAINSIGADASIKVSGGTVSGSANGIKVAGAESKVEVSGSGNVKALDAIRIASANCTVTVSDGAVSTVGPDFGSAIYLGDASSFSKVTVSGGTLSAEGAGASHAICTGELSGASTITVSGGILKSVGEYGTIHAKGNTATVNVSGGFVFGYGNDILGEKKVIYMKSGAPAISGTAVVCAWDKPASGTPTYNAGTAEKLTVEPAGKAVWGKESSQNGIKFENGTNKGFLPVSGVTVAAAAVFTVKFDSNGGSTVADLSVASGGKATKPANPTKAGSTFEGWYKEEALTTAYDFDDLVTANITLYAKWTASATSGGMANFLQVNTYKSGMFTDVSEDAWYGFNQQRVVARAYEYGLMKGNSATTFNPTGNVTVAEAITIAARVHSIYTSGTENFVQGAVWYQVYVDYALAKGIIEAADFSNYTRAATRAEMAYIFSRSLPAAELAEQNTVNSLPDVNSGTPYRDAIFALYKAGVLTGSDEKGTFNPGNNITRAEAAAIITRVILPDTRAKGRTF